MTQGRAWGNDTDVNHFCGEISMNFERRITRSCSRLARQKVEVGKFSENSNTQKGSNLSKQKTIESKGRKPRSSVKLICCNKREKKGSDACQGFKSGSKKISSDTVLQCVARGGQRRWQNNIADYCEKDGKTDSSCKGVIGVLDRRITRSCSRLGAQKVEVGEFSENAQKSSNFSKHKTCESKEMKLRSSVNLISCNKRKEKKSDACKAFKSSKGITSDSVSQCRSRGVRRCRQNNFTDYHEKNGKTENLCKEFVGIMDRRITRSASKLLGEKNDSCCQIMERQSTHIPSKQVVGNADEYAGDDGLKGMKTHDCIEVDHDKFEQERSDALPLDIPGKGERSNQDFTMGTKLIGVKRKRKQVELQEAKQGWTKEQEIELQRAYYTAKPSPHFWKTVAKLVPGKSAQECFDKVHSDNQTPLCTKPSSRRKRNSPMFNIELFNSTKPRSKKTCKRKKSHVGRKTVRHLLQKYCHVNQDSEADLFSVLEPSVNPTAEAYNQTPEHLMRSPESSSKSRDRPSGHKKCPRLSNGIESPLTSPPVLKKVKNMLLHEKYIDQLHTREHKRNVVSRCVKSAQSQKNGEENSLNLNVIKTAKESLVSEAKDVINRYRHTQSHIMEALSDSEEFLNSDNDEEETVM